MKEAFENYVKNYDMDDPDINYKYKHSYRVLAQSEWLSKSLNLSEEDIKIAKIIGLYHDIGRFEEDKRFNSFGIHENFDHGDYGRDILLKEKLIEKIPIEKKYYNLIAKAVEIHNKYEIEKGLDEKTTLHCKIIRDADKIDILRSAANDILTEKAFNRDAKAEDVSEEVKEEFYKELQIKKRKKTNHSDADKILSFLGLIYDINYKQSIEYIVKNNILEKLYKLLKYKEGFKEYFDYTNKYIEKRYNDVRN